MFHDLFIVIYNITKISKLKMFDFDENEAEF